MTFAQPPNKSAFVWSLKVRSWGVFQFATFAQPPNKLDVVPFVGAWVGFFLSLVTRSGCSV